MGNIIGISSLYTLPFNDGERRPPPPICSCCGVSVTVKHILNECRMYDKERRLNFISNHLTEILNPDPNNIFRIIQFLSETRLINKL